MIEGQLYNKIRPPRILGLCASLRSGRWGKGAQILVDQLKKCSSENMLKAFLQSESEVHLKNFLQAGRNVGLPFDEQYANLKKMSGRKGLCNSEVVLTAALWSARQIGCEIEALSLSDFFPASGKSRNLDTLKKALLRADGILVSTPVYFGDRSSLLHDLICYLRLDHELQTTCRGRLYAGIAVGAKRNGGQETTLIYQIVDMVNTGFLAVGNDSETTAQYGGTCHAGDVGTAWKDDYGLWTSMGTGRRIARAAFLLTLADSATLRDKLRVGFWITQDQNKFAQKQIERLAEEYSDEIEAKIFNTTEKNFARCLACDICPRDIGPDLTYRCWINKNSDWFKKIHSDFLEIDAIVPVAFIAKNLYKVKSTYQRFNERTRYLRRGDYVFTDFAVAPLLFEEIGANDSHRIRVLTSLLRHHTIMTRPIISYLHEDKILNNLEVKMAWNNFIMQAKRLTAGRLMRALHDQNQIYTKYNPVGYVLSSTKDKEDEKLNKRSSAIKERTNRLLNMARERLEIL